MQPFPIIITLAKKKKIMLENRTLVDVAKATLHNRALNYLIL